MRFFFLLLGAALAVQACSTPTGDSDAETATANFASVPVCTSFDLHAAIAATHDLSPDYQCEVSSTLSRSSQPDERWIRSLSDPSIRERPFRSVVNLRGENGANGEAPIVESAGMTALNIRVKDLTAPNDDQVDQFLGFVADPAHQPTLVHCKAGQGRTGTFVAIYRFMVQGWSVDDAVAEARSFNVNEEQLAFVRAYASRHGH